MILQPEIATLGVSLNGGTPISHPKCWSFLVGKPHGFVGFILGNNPHISLHCTTPPPRGFPGTPRNPPVEPGRWVITERMKPSFSSSKSWNQTFLGEHDFLAGCIYPYHPWDWYIYAYAHEWLIFMVNVGKYTQTVDGKKSKLPTSTGLAGFSEPSTVYLDGGNSKICLCSPRTLGKWSNFD